MSENIPHSLGGFRGAFESEHGRKPTEQEIWNAAIRSWRDITRQKSDSAKELEEVIADLLMYAGDVVVFGVDPDKRTGALGEGHGQQRQAGIIFDCAALFFAGLAAGGGFNVRNLLVHLAFQHVTGHSLYFGGQFENGVTTNDRGEFVMLATTGRNPAHRLLLAGAAGHKAAGFQQFGKVVRDGRLDDFEQLQIFEHVDPE